MGETRRKRRTVVKAEFLASFAVFNRSPEHVFFAPILENGTFEGGKRLFWIDCVKHGGSVENLAFFEYIIWSFWLRYYVLTRIIEYIEYPRLMSFAEIDQFGATDLALTEAGRETVVVKGDESAVVTFEVGGEVYDEDVIEIANGVAAQVEVAAHIEPNPVSRARIIMGIAGQTRELLTIAKKIALGIL